MSIGVSYTPVSKFTSDRALTASHKFIPKPPPQKERPTQPLPSTPHSQLRTRSSTFSAITAWAAHVQPGSPAPCSPLHPSSPLYSGRRASFSVGIATSPCSFKGFATDLTTLGYSSLFVHLPGGPLPAALSPPASGPLVRPSEPEPKSTLPAIPLPPIPASPPPKTRTIKHFRSLSMLKRTRSKSSGSLPPSSDDKGSSTSLKPRKSSKESIARGNKAKYGKALPPPLAAELALAQFADGGSMESHVKRVMEHQAKAAAGVGHGRGVAVGDVYRDGSGGIWWDQDEEWEYAHLLGGEQDVSRDETEWVRFDSDRRPSFCDGNGEDFFGASAIIELAGGGRDRRASVCTQDSDLDPRFEVQPIDQDDLAVFVRRTGVSPSLAIPSRTRRPAPHMLKSEAGMDPAFIPKCVTSRPVLPSPSPRDSKPRGSSRRRPAPLTLDTPVATSRSKRPIAVPTSQDTPRARQEFPDSSFAPEPLVSSTPRSPQPAPPATPHRKARGVMGLFKSSKRDINQI